MIVNKASYKLYAMMLCAIHQRLTNERSVSISYNKRNQLKNLMTTRELVLNLWMLLKIGFT